MKKVKILFIVIIMGMCTILTESVSYGFALNISPSSVKITVKQGETKSGTITVFNNGKIDMGINAYTQDWLYQTDGSISFYGAGTTKFSCAKWMRIFPMKFNLKGGEKMGVQYSINVPADAEGGYCAVIFFESFPLSEAKGEEGGMTVQFAGRLGALVYLEIEGKAIHKGHIESLSITPPQSDKPFEMKLAFKNAGNTYIGAQGTLNIVDEEGNIFAKEKFGPLTTLPGDVRERTVEWLGELKEGTYIAVVTLDIGTEAPIVEEKKFEVFFGGTIDSFSVDVSGEKPSFSVIVKNTGQLNIEPAGRIEVLKEDKGVVKVLNLEKTLIAPGQEKELKVNLEESLAQGTYTAKAIISIGNKELVKEEIFTIK